MAREAGETIIVTVGRKMAGRCVPGTQNDISIQYPDSS
jgi:hypothetical protein